MVCSLAFASGCVARTELTAERSNTCVANAECPEACVGGACVAFASGGQACEASDDCAADLFCLGGRCRADDGAACADNDACVAVCIDGICAPTSPDGGPCDDTADCEPGLDCVTDICHLLGNPCGGPVHDALLPYASGDGSLANPYLLCTAQQLTYLATASADWDKRFRLASDIDLTGVSFTPIGAAEPHFSGKIDGNGWTITGLTQSLLGETDRGAYIRDLTIDGAVIEAPAADTFGVLGTWMANTTLSNIAITNVQVRGRNRVGGVAGVCDNCFVEDLTVSGVISGNVEVGGAFGGSDGVGVLGARLDVTVTASDSDAGGLVGYLWIRDELQDVHVRGSVTGGDNVGGIGGGADVEECYRMSFVGDITGGEFVGGLFGASRAFPADIRSSAVVATISGNRYVGGIIGRCDSYTTIVDCYADGVINATGATPSHVGGLVGERISGTFALERSYSSVTINAGAADYVGGLIGALWPDTGDPPVRDNFFAGMSVSGDSATGAVSFAFGETADGVFTNNYHWDGATCTNGSGSCNSANVSPTTYDQLLGPSSELIEWDFTNVWTSVPDGLPVLSYQSDYTPTVAADCPTTAAVGTQYICDIEITDADANERQFVRVTEQDTCEWLPRGPRYWLGEFVGTPADADAGTCRLSFVVTDGTNVSMVTEIDIVVSP